MQWEVVAMFILGTFDAPALRREYPQTIFVATGRRKRPSTAVAGKLRHGLGVSAWRSRGFFRQNVDHRFARLR
jgi:hypothetical protein